MRSTVVPLVPPASRFRSSAFRTLPWALRTAAVWAVVLVFLLAVATPGQAQMARVDAIVSVDSVTVGEPFTLSVTAEHRFGSEIRFPSVGDGPLVFGTLDVLARSDVRERYLGSDGPGLKVDSVAYQVAAFGLSSVQIPALPVEVIVGSDTLLIRTEPQTIAIAATVPPDETRLRDIAPLAPFSQPLWPWALLVIGMLILIGALAYWWWTSREETLPDDEAFFEPDTTPLEALVARFNALQSRRINGDPKPFYDELSKALRTYLSQRLSVTALESTTGELVHDLRRHPHVPSRTAQRIQRILERADLVKFADANPDTEDAQTALREAKHAVRTLEDSIPADALNETSNGASETTASNAS